MRIKETFSVTVRGGNLGGERGERDGFLIYACSVSVSISLLFWGKGITRSFLLYGMLVFLFYNTRDSDGIGGCNNTAPSEGEEGITAG
jgi:hypothetical protein